LSYVDRDCLAIDRALVSQPAIDAFEPRNLGSKKRDFYTRDSVSRFFLVD